VSFGAASCAEIIHFPVKMAFVLEKGHKEYVCECIGWVLICSGSASPSILKYCHLKV